MPKNGDRASGRLGERAKMHGSLANCTCNASRLMVGTRLESCAGRPVGEKLLTEEDVDREPPGRRNVAGRVIPGCPRGPHELPRMSLK